jgi:hypothetical protein
LADRKDYYSGIDLTRNDHAGLEAPAFPDFEDRIQMARDRERLAEKRARYAASLSRRETISGEYPDVGRFIIPSAGPAARYRDHWLIYESSKDKIEFNANKYTLFDGAIVDILQQAKGPFFQGYRHEALFNPRHKHSKHYEAMRQNIAILRNAIYSELFDDGEFDPNDPSDRKKMEHIREMGRYLGHELLAISDNAARKAFFVNFIPNLLTLGLYGMFKGPKTAEDYFGTIAVPHQGAQELYKTLERAQQGINLNPFRTGPAKPRYAWNLDPLHLSPFRDLEIRQAEANDVYDRYLGLPDPAGKLYTQAVELEQRAANLWRVENMAPPDLRTSVNLAHLILDKLKNTITANTLLIERTGSLDSRNILQQSTETTELGVSFSQVIAGMAKADPRYRNSAQFEEDRLLVAKLGHLTLLAASNEAARQGDANRVEEIKTMLRYLPEEFTRIDPKTNVHDIIHRMEIRLKEANRLLVGQGVNLQEIEFDPATKALLDSNLSMIAGDTARIASSTASAIEIAKQINLANEARLARAQQHRQKQQQDQRYRVNERREDNAEKAGNIGPMLN